MDNKYTRHLKINILKNATKYFLIYSNHCNGCYFLLFLHQALLFNKSKHGYTKKTMKRIIFFLLFIYLFAYLSPFLHRLEYY